jgi:hypothetical protein
MAVEHLLTGPLSESHGETAHLLHGHGVLLGPVQEALAHWRGSSAH